MKILLIFALFALSVVVKGSWWAAAVQPIILSFGALFAALDLDLEPLLNVNLLDLREWMKANGKYNEEEYEIMEEEVREENEIVEEMRRNVLNLNVTNSDPWDGKYSYKNVTGKESTAK